VNDASSWTGVDLGEEVANICVIDSLGKVLIEASCYPDADQIAGVLAGAPAPTLVGLEAGMGTRLTRELRTAGFEVAVFEALAVHRFLEIFHNKTDAGDARGIAEIARLGQSVIPKVYVKSKECQVTRSLLGLRQKAVRQRISIQGVLRSLFRLHMDRTISFRAPARVAEQVQAELERLSSDGIDLGAEVRPLLSVWESLRKFELALDRRLYRLAREIPACKRLLTIPGVGTVLALSFYTAIEDPHRFPNASRVGVYLGLAPRLNQTGKTSRFDKPRRRGSKLTRLHLVIGAKAILRKDAQASALKEWGTALIGRIGYHRARVAVARKLAVVMLTVWKTGAEYTAFPSGSGGLAPRIG